MEQNAKTRVLINGIKAEKICKKVKIVVDKSRTVRHSVAMINNTQTAEGSGIKWENITRFNFSWATAGGAWLEDATGYRNWFPTATIERHLGCEWFQKMLRKQGWMTGCWISTAE